MGAAGIELPEFVTGKVIERTYHRAMKLQDKGARDHYAGRMLLAGMNRARARDPLLLLFLEKGADHLQKVNDSQQDRFDEGGHRRQDFSEFATWREAYQRASEPQAHEDVMYRVYGWVYAAVHEALASG